MIIAITGGTGFIGKRLTEKLTEQGHELRILSRTKTSPPSENIKFYRDDLTKPSSLNDFLTNVDVLFHCAGETKNPSIMRKTHVDGTRNLVTAATGRVKRWVQLSSVGVYGPNHDTLITESTQYNPKGLYETTKAESDQIVLEAFKAGNILPTLLRPSNVYGPEMSNPYLYQLISAVDKGYFFFIGKKGALMSNIHVDNLVDALILCANHPAAPGKIFNLSDELPIEKYIEIIARTLEKSTPRLRLPKRPLKSLAKILNTISNKIPLSGARIDALSRHTKYSCDQIKNELDYTHSISLESGLVEMVGFYKKHV